MWFNCCRCFNCKFLFSCIIQNCLVKRQVSKGIENFQFLLISGLIWQCFDIGNSRICDKLLNVEWTRNRLHDLIVVVVLIANFLFMYYSKSSCEKTSFKGNRNFSVFIRQRSYLTMLWRTKFKNLWQITKRRMNKKSTLWFYCCCCFNCKFPFSCIIQNHLAKRQVSKGTEIFQFLLDSVLIWQCFDTRNSRICDKLLNDEWTRNRLCDLIIVVVRDCKFQNCLVKRQVSKGTESFQRFY